MDQIVIAEGSAARPGRNGRVTFHFETEFTNPGKINQDGTIDFRDRGETPFVKSEDLMAEKDPAVEGRPGTSVYGETIEVPEVEDPPFEAGAGTTLSEDGLTIHAALDGQPHLDKLGTISVNPELVIPGDVDFETGNIDFQGNIVVKGMIKEGFQVKGIHVTAKEIEGGIIDISGDLNVSAGITDATISAQGNVYAKFVNHSNINAYGDLCVQKEIIDSTILLSGRCVNASGHIIASAITAKLGIETGAVGTPSAGVSTFKVGVDEHIEKLIETVNQQLETSIEKTKMIKADIKAKEDEDHALYEHISERAQIQDRAQVDMKEMLKELKALKDAGDTAQIPQVTDEIKKMKETAATAEKELNSIFETQDRIADEISRMKNSLAAVEEENKKHVQKRKALRTFAKKDAPAAEVLVSKTAVQGTIIKGPHSSIILPEDRSNIKIHETRDPESPANLYMMAVSDG